MKQDPNCDNCQVNDTLTHFFFQCDQVKYVWKGLIKWWNRSTLTQTNLNISEIDIFWGHFLADKDKFNLNVILLAKNYIHACKLTKPTYIFFLLPIVLVRQE